MKSNKRIGSCVIGTWSCIIGAIITVVIIVLISVSLAFWIVPYLSRDAAPSAFEVAEAVGENKTNCIYTGEFSKDRKGSDLGHWGEGDICVTNKSVVFTGRLALGPDYYLYYASKYVETRQEFKGIKGRSVRGNKIKSFNGFIQDIPSYVDIEKVNALVVWCEMYGVYITSTKLNKKITSKQ